MPLPGLSVPSKSQLQALSPVAMVPEWISQRGQVAASLLKIEYVEVKSVVDRRGDRSYVVEVYEYTSKNRIPTNRRTRHVADSSRKPNARIQREYSAFASLRSEAYNHVYLAHNVFPCAFCKGVIDEIVWGDDQPGGLLKLFSSEDKVVQTLAKSVNSFLALVKSHVEGRLCTGQDNVTQVLHDFLSKDDSTTR